MNTTTLSELKSEVSEVFSVILLFCPNFPPIAQTNTAKKFEQLNGLLDTILEKMRNDDAKQWLRICQQEIEQSRKHYEGGNRKLGRDLIQRAEEHFKNAFAQRATAPRFVVGESGAALDSESGFPQ